MKTTRLVLAPLLILASVLFAAPSSASPGVLSRVSGIRVGHHATFDRVVIDTNTRSVPDVEGGYVDEFIQDGSGNVIRIRGRHMLQVVLSPAQAHRNDGSPLVSRRQVVRNFDQVKATKLIGDFEGYVQIGIGTRCVRDVHIFVLRSPVRVVVDIPHC